MILDAALDKIPGKQRRTGSTSSKVCCVAHDEQDPSLHLSEKDDKLLWHCHAGCPQDAVAEALRSLGVDFGTPSVSAPPPSADRGWTADQFLDWNDASRASLLHDDRAMSYLSGRGITADEAFAHGLGLGVRGAGKDFDALQGRITITVGTHHAEGRILSGEGPKWKTLRGARKSAWWAGESGPHVLVEGAWDAIAVARIGGVGISVGGLNISEFDIGRLRMRDVKDVYMCPDQDKRSDYAILTRWVDSLMRVTDRVWICEGNPWGDLGDLLLLNEEDFAMAMSSAMTNLVVPA